MSTRHIVLSMTILITSTGLFLFLLPSLPAMRATVPSSSSAHLIRHCAQRGATTADRTVLFSQNTDILIDYYHLIIQMYSTHLLR